MESVKATQYQLEIEPLTAVVIGNGNTIDYASYHLLKDDVCAVVDVNKVIARIMTEGADADKTRLTAALDDVDNLLVRLRQIVADAFSDDDVLYTTHIPRKLVNKMTNPSGNLNVNEIYRCPLRGKMIPVIPGSSLKGAIRTAYTGIECLSEEKLDNDLYEALKQRINDLSDLWKDKDIERAASSIESEIDARLLFSSSLTLDDRAFTYSDKNCKNAMENPQHSIMRMLHVSDAMPLRADTSFASTQILGKRMGKALPIIDCILGRLTEGHSKFKGVLTVQLKEGMQNGLELGKLVSNCNMFYRRKFEEEYDKVIAGLIGREGEEYFDKYSELSRIVKAPRKEGEFLLRIGRYSQREFVTYGNDLRFVKSTKNDNPKWGATRTMMLDVDSYIPLGWCLCNLNPLPAVT